MTELDDWMIGFLDFWIARSPGRQCLQSVDPSVQQRVGSAIRHLPFAIPFA